MRPLLGPSVAGRLASALAATVALLASAGPFPAQADDLDGLPAWLLGPYPEDGRLYAPGVSLDATDAAAAEIEARAMAEALLAFQTGAQVSVFARATADSLARTGKVAEEKSKDSALVQVTGTLPAEAKVEVVRRWTSGRRIALLLAVRDANGWGGGPVTFFLRAMGEVSRGRTEDRGESLEFAAGGTTRLGAAARSALADLGLALAERALQHRARVHGFTSSSESSWMEHGIRGLETRLMSLCQAMADEEPVRFRLAGLSVQTGARGPALSVRLAPEGREVPVRSASDDGWESFGAGPCPAGPAQGVLCALGVYDGPALELGALVASAEARCELAILLAARAAAESRAPDPGAAKAQEVSLEGTRVVRSRTDGATGRSRVMVAAPAEAKVRPVSTPSR